jgi:hypothetical protein
MQYQPAFQLEKPVELLPPRKVKPKLPMPMVNRPNKNLFVHIAFERINQFPPPTKSKPHPVKKICPHINLPCLETEKDLAAWGERWHSISLIKWKCWSCGLYHQWSVPGYVADTNGGTNAGSDVVPDRIMIEFQDPRNKKLFWLGHKLETIIQLPPPR